MYIDVFFCPVHLAQNSMTLVTPYIFSIGQARCSTKQLEIFEKIRPGQGMESPLDSGDRIIIFAGGKTLILRVTRVDVFYI